MFGKRERALHVKVGVMRGKQNISDNNSVNNVLEAKENIFRINVSENLKCISIFV